ncbi:MAG: 16S rRNA (guanine(966)-N(2))-methyltransferase RsmD [Betaproteobacteria bacterium]|nr:MAG: 16S rRNA (guanine(966)-N(2))-methyltransferase RsmD [Betaproteobacteria bacterium]
MAKSNQVRIIGGVWRSRRISFPEHEGLRPSADRVRETLFNWLGQDLGGQRCLDLFAGSGALGFEALSRGAASVVMVEKSRRVCAALRRNALLLGAKNLQLHCADALEFATAAAADAAARFDVMFLDPPFGSTLLGQALPRIVPLLGPEARVYVESAVAFAPTGGWRVLRHGRAGQVHYTLVTYD